MERKRCDVLVIGSGIGGMCAAARLAHAGYKTVVVEKSLILGGRYTYVEYRGFKVETGARSIFLGNKDPVLQTLRDVGAPEIEARSALDHRYRIKGKDYKTPEKGGLWAIIGYSGVSSAEADRVVSAVRVAIMGDEVPKTMSFKEWLRQYTENRIIHNILVSFISTSSCVGPSSISAADAISAFKMFKTGEPTSLPKNGLKEIINSLEKVIKDNKGDLLTGTGATGIIIEDGLARGITAQRDGERLEIEAKVVISNVGPKGTIELAKAENFDRGYLQEVNCIRPAEGLSYNIVSNRPLIDFNGFLFLMDTRRPWCFGGNLWPEHAPKGKNIVRVVVFPESTTNWNPKREHEIFLQDLKEQFPKFEEYGGEILLARKWSGVWPYTRAWIGHCVSQKTPIENLYNVGDGACPPGWTCGPGAAESARLVVDDIKARFTP